MRKICVVTGSRAEYGHLYWLMKEIETDSDLTLQIVATGAHLSSEFGSTFKAIEQDGFVLNEKLELPLSDDSVVAITKALGIATGKFAEAFQVLKPDLIVLLGDRYEILAAAQAALLARIPIAHIHGGESTEGLIDEAVRHSITKMAHLHFVSNPFYRNRVIQLGEDPSHVICYGAPGLDHLDKTVFLTRKELAQKFGIQFGDFNFLITMHPVTLSNQKTEEMMNALFHALDHFQEAHLIFTRANADPAGLVINKLIDQYAEKNKNRAKVCVSLGQQGYLSVICEVDVVIGNSSSGIIEVPHFQKPTVNIGDRQRGRLKAESIIDCKESEKEITAAIKKALSPDFQKTLSQTQSLYGKGGDISKRIKDKIKSAKLENVLMKKFHDLPIESLASKS